jgi:shikimate dehydrogenase
MKLFTIFGNPVSHSKSPNMHNFAFSEFKVDANYSKTHLEDGYKIKEEFKNQNFSGANVTVPHKEIAYEICDEVIGIANQIKAVNTIINRNGKLYGYNTDAPGFIEAIKEFGDIKNILIIGAGGTAKSLALIFKQHNINTTVLNRSESRFEFYKDLGLNTFTWDNFEVSDYDLVVNSTSAGLSDDSLPLPKKLLENIFKHTKYAVDVIYGKQTPFLKLAKELKLQTKDGEDMLLYQGVLAFELFTDIKINQNLIDTMRQGLKEG